MSCQYLPLSPTLHQEEEAEQEAEGMRSHWNLVSMWVEVAGHLSAIWLARLYLSSAKRSTTQLTLPLSCDMVGEVTAILEFNGKRELDLQLPAGRVVLACSPSVKSICSAGCR